MIFLYGSKMFLVIVLHWF